MTETPDWKPLLTGPEAEPIRAVVLELADQLERRADELLATVHPQRQASLVGGHAGLALFFAYLATALPDEERHERWADLATRHLDRAGELLASEVTPPSLYTGFAGVGWVGEHLTGRLFAPPEEGEEDGNEGIDEALLAWVSHRPWQQDYDLILGLAGAAVYAAERLPRPVAVAMLERVVEQLSALAQEVDGTLAWRTPPELLPDHQRRRLPDGCYNTGVAHGIPALLPLLAVASTGLAATSPDAAAEARRLLDGGVEFLLSHRVAPEAGQHFPYQIAEGIEPEPCRLAWCYGDPGVAAALWSAGHHVGHQGWQREALAVALDAARVPDADSGVQDPGLCHGAAGLVHVFNRLYVVSGEEALGRAARHWLGRTLDYRDEGLAAGRGVAGFAAYHPTVEEPRTFTWEDDPGFLTGAAGVGLALLATISDVEPAWDRVLAMSVPEPR